MKKVSIALCTYNGEDFLEKQFDSILLQDYPIYEIIICDDCSIDSTKKIISSYQRKLPQLVKVFFNEINIGYKKNFERAISLCSGDYIALCDQDDIWEKNKISTLIFEIKNSDAIHSDALLIDRNNNIISTSFTRTAKKSIKKKSFINLLINNTVTGCTLLFKRDLLVQPFIVPSVIAHDHWIALLAFSKNGLKYCNKKLIQYRQHEKNTIGVFRTEETKKRNRSDIFCSRINDFSIIKRSMSTVFPAKYINDITLLIFYYNSYFLKRLRFKTFLFHLKYISAFSHRKKFLSTVNALFFSLFGKISNPN